MNTFCTTVQSALFPKKPAQERLKAWKTFTAVLSQSGNDSVTPQGSTVKCLHNTIIF